MSGHLGLRGPGGKQASASPAGKRAPAADGRAKRYSDHEDSVYSKHPPSSRCLWPFLSLICTDSAKENTHYNHPRSPMEGELKRSQNTVLIVISTWKKEQAWPGQLSMHTQRQPCFLCSNSGLLSILFLYIHAAKAWVFCERLPLELRAHVHLGCDHVAKGPLQICHVCA